MTLLGISITPHNMELLRDAISHPYVCNPIVAAAAIQGIGSLLGNIFGGASAAKANRESMKFQEHMYDRQRADALSDWNMQNEYNSPIQQMARLKAGGLNPALFYGGGTTGITSAQSVRSSSPGSFKAESFRPDLSGIANAAMNAIMMKKQAANLDAQNDLIHAQAEETRSRIPKNQADTASVLFDTDLKRELRPLTVAIKEGDMQKIVADTNKVYNDIDLSQQKNLREITMQKYDIKEKVANTVKILAETENIKLSKEKIQSEIESLNLENLLKQTELDARHNGFSWHDSIMPRVLVSLAKPILDKLAKDIKDDVWPEDEHKARRDASKKIKEFAIQKGAPYLW